MEDVIKLQPFYFAANWTKITLSRDFFHNCITKDPFLHSHPVFELHYIDCGNCTVETKTGTAECHQGSFVLVSPQCIHRLLPQDECTKTISLMFELTDDQLHLSTMQEREFWIFPDSFGGEKQLLRIREELLQRRPMYREKVQGELICLVANVFRVLGEAKIADSDSYDDRAEQIHAYLMEHRFDPECSSKGLARALHLSERQAQRLCIKYYGATFRQMLTSMRMEIAADRLRTTDTTVETLAQKLGYSSASYFSAAYKRHFGVAPSKNRTLENRT